MNHLEFLSNWGCQLFSMTNKYFEVEILCHSNGQRLMQTPSVTLFGASKIYTELFDLVCFVGLCFECLSTECPNYSVI